MDRRILLTIIDKFSGGPVGLNHVATAVGEESGTIEEVYEPFLIMEGYLQRTPRGRHATDGLTSTSGRWPVLRRRGCSGRVNVPIPLSWIPNGRSAKIKRKGA
jgi:hypothetical protein